MKPIKPEPARHQHPSLIHHPVKMLMYWTSVLLMLMILGAGAWMVYDYFRIDFDAPMHLPEFEADVIVKGGDSFSKIANQLVEKGFMRSPRPLRILAEQQGTIRKLKPGHYRISSAISIRDLHDMLLEGNPGRVTFPEGFRINQFAERLIERKILAPEQAREFIELANSEAYIKSELKMELPSLEGYLWPDTYYFAPGATPHEVIRRLVNSFQQRTKGLREQTPPHGLTWHEVVILGSMIEKETYIDKEKPIVASVYFNRLKKNYYLQCDATVRYALEVYGRGLTKWELKTENPYNTYKHKGLPPGPIGSPGYGSLHAAMNPADTDYLYYCLKDDGAHAFAKTNREHNRNVRKYLRR